MTDEKLKQSDSDSTAQKEDDIDLNVLCNILSHKVLTLEHRLDVLEKSFQRLVDILTKE